MARVARIPFALSVLLAAAPALAQVKVLVTAPAHILFGEAVLKCTATVTGTGNPAVHWSVTRDQAPVGDALLQPGWFKAPAGAPSAVYRIRATSVADDKAYDELAVSVVAVGGGVHGTFPVEVTSVLQGYLGHPNPALNGLPARDMETGKRYDPAAPVEEVPLNALFKPEPADGSDFAQPRQVLGYGLEAPVRWDPTVANRTGLWLSFREGEDMVRSNPTGKDHQMLKLTSWVRDATLEVLERKPGPEASWMSATAKLDFHVRGVVPYAGRSVYGSHWDAGGSDGVDQGARFRQPLGMASLEDGADGCVLADPEGHTLRTVSATGEARTLCGADQ